MATRTSTRCICILVLFLFYVESSAQTSQISNGSFADWDENGPIGWTVEVGATNGQSSPLSIVKQGKGPSLELSGNADTMAWQAVSQSLPIKGGQSFRLRFSFKTAGLKRERNQFENCYISAQQKDHQGKILSRNIQPLESDEFQESSIIVRMHEMAAEAQVLIFLSKTGTLIVKDIAMEALDPEDSFQLLVDEMDRHYSYFAHKKIDWPKLTEKYRTRVDSTDPDKFTEVVSEMLAEIKDSHIWLAHRRRRISKYIQRFQANFNFAFVDEHLEDVKKFGRFGTTAITDDGWGYVRISSLTVEPQIARELAQDIRRRLFATPGIIIDGRRNRGGAEGLAQQIGSLFAKRQTLYARSKFRSGPNHDQFKEAAPRKIEPSNAVYDGPVVFMTGPGAVSSAEGFAMIMKALPNVTVIGQPTRGSSGNPAPVQLPNGVDVWFSRWVSMMPDGTPIEGDGVAPDETVEHGEGDPTYVRAVELLKKTEK